MTEGVLLTLTLLPTYPSSLPLISVLSQNLTRNECDFMKIWLMEKSKNLVNSPMLFQIISLAYEYLEEKCVKSEEIDLKTPSLVHFKIYVSILIIVNLILLDSCILRLDHMRDRSHYFKLILSWTRELNLVGRLFFCQKLILILLQGTKEDIKKYICRNRTQIVDVDAKGRPCKERLLLVLEDVTNFERIFTDFQVEELNSLEELKKSFRQRGLGEVFDRLKLNI
ncbi:RWD domain-containing protein 3 [Armadillidium vulgare]|nr:RWD domain-containing protein 3 [Armadillidium vulgare]